MFLVVFPIFCYDMNSFHSSRKLLYFLINNLDLSCKFCLLSAAFWMYSSSLLTDLIPCSLRKITDSSIVLRLCLVVQYSLPLLSFTFILVFISITLPMRFLTAWVLKDAFSARRSFNLS